MDILELARFGVPTLLSLAILGLIYVLNKKYRESPKGDRRAPQRVVGCPNKMEGLSATLTGMLANLDASTRMLTELLHIMEETKAEVRRVADVASIHATGSRSEKIREESRDLLRDLLMEVRQSQLRGN